MTTRQYTESEKLEAVRREIAYRERVYRRKVEDRSMSRAEANYQIGVMKAIEADYLPKARKEELPL